MNTATKRADEPLRQPDVFELTSWSGSELVILAHAFVKFSIEFEAARSQRNFARMQAAFDKLKETQDQATFVGVGVQKSIDNEANRRGVAG